MVALPLAAPIARPLLPTVATWLSDELQLTWPVRFRAVPSLNEPVALNCSLSFTAMLALLGDIVMESSVALVTDREPVPTTPAKSAVINAFPGLMPVASPLEPDALLIVATEAGDEVQTKDCVRSCEPSGKLPMAKKGNTMLTGTWGFVGVMVTELGADDSTTTLAVALTDP